MDDSCASIDDSCASMDDSVASEVKQVSHGSLKSKDNSPTHYIYTAEQLLQKKKLQGKLNGPQAFFSYVMKDAAIAAVL